VPAALRETEADVATILLVPYWLRGHIEPMLALARALAARHHRVSVFAAAESAGPFVEAGLPVVHPVRWRRDEPRSSHGGGAGAALRHVAYGCLAQLTREVQRAAVQTGADIVVTDAFQPAGGLAAEREGLPWVSVACNPGPDPGLYRDAVDPEVRAYFEAPELLDALGVASQPVNLLDRTSPYLHLIPSTPLFAGQPDLPAHVALVGPLAPVPQPAGAGALTRTDRRRVVVTTSTVPRDAVVGRGVGQERYLRTVMLAARDEPVDMVMTVAQDQLPGGAATRPPNVRVVGPVPHNGLFRECDAVVTHAGWGTVGRALMHGLPLVMVPMAVDQAGIAQRCEQLGLGIVLDPRTMTVAGTREAIRSVCERPRYRRAATAFAAEVHAMRPLATAASLIASVPWGAGGSHPTADSGALA
jgi:UDP:flavonoid glycosyltransferase YjiC (YdhE family)